MYILFRNVLIRTLRKVLLINHKQMFQPVPTYFLAKRFYTSLYRMTFYKLEPKQDPLIIIILKS